MKLQQLSSKIFARNITILPNEINELANFIFPKELNTYDSAGLLVHGQVTIIFVVSVGLSVCLSVCLFVYAEFFSAVFDPISIKLGHMLYVWV